MWSGKALRLENYLVKPEKIELHLAPVSYMETHATENPKYQEIFVSRGLKLPPLMANCAVLETKDGSFVFTKRPETVSKKTR